MVTRDQDSRSLADPFNDLTEERVDTLGLAPKRAMCVALVVTVTGWQDTAISVYDVGDVGKHQMGVDIVVIAVIEN